MTLSSEQSEQFYAGNDSASTFSVPFKVRDKSHLEIVEITDATGAERTLVENTDFTFSNLTAQVGWNINLIEPVINYGAPRELPTGYTLRIRRVPPFTQGVDLRNAGAFRPETHEDVFDYLTMLAQRLRDKCDDLADRVSAMVTQVVQTIRLNGATSGYTDLTTDPIAGAGTVNFPQTAGTEQVAYRSWSLATFAANTGASLIGFIQAAAGAVIQTVQAKLGYIYELEDFGAVGDGVADDTAAFNAAKAAIPASGGRIKLRRGKKYALNAVYDKSGVIIQGHTTEARLAPTSGYLTAFDPTKPVIQYSKSGSWASGCGLEKVAIYGNNTCQYGVAFVGGAMRNYAEKVQILNFTKRCLSFACEAGVAPCTFNKVNGLTVATSVVGADGVYFEDNGTDDTAYTTANNITDFDITADNGYQVRVNSANGNFLNNGYIQQSYDGLGVLFEKGYTRTPMLFTSNVIMDNAAGATAHNQSVDVGQDWRTTGAFTPTPWTGLVANTGPTFVVSNSTTGSINAAAAALTLASTTGVVAGRYVIVAGAGPSGRPLVAKVKTLVGSVATLDTNASTTVVSAVTKIGDSVQDNNFLQAGNNVLSGAGLQLYPSKMTDLPWEGYKGALYKGGSTRSFQPLSGSHPFWDLGSLYHIYLQFDGGSYTVSSITQSGTTVTLTTSGSHAGVIGDIVQINGVKEEGINGTWVITSRTATTLTFTSTASQTLASVTGTPTLRINKVSGWRNGHLDLGRSLRLRDQSGNWQSVLFSGDASDQVNFQMPSATNGSLVVVLGNAATTSARFVLVTSVSSFYVNGYGAIGLGSNNPDTSWSVALTKRAAGTPAANAAYGTLWCDSTGALKYISPAGTVTTIAPA